MNFWKMKIFWFYKHYLGFTFFSLLSGVAPHRCPNGIRLKKDTMFTYTCQEHDFYLSKAWFLPVQSIISTCPEHNFYLSRAWFLPVQSMISTCPKHNFYLSRAWFLPVQLSLSSNGRVTEREQSAAPASMKNPF